MASETELLISQVGFPPFSARNCHQQLTPIRSGEFRRTVNGNLVYVGRETHHKFKTVITCEDRSTIAFYQFAMGVEVDVSCIQSLWQEVTLSTGAIQLLRPAVENTVIVQDQSHTLLPFRLENRVSLMIQAPPKTKALIRYCPILRMRVTHFNLSTQEWSEKSSWSLELEEI